ncbi:MAG: RagB/SusD family nutrient uptake outer membrane protein [Cyclobacteriaceae bacterium]
MKKKTLINVLIALIGAVLFDCKDSFLDRPPQGAIDQTSLKSEKGVNALLISAYSSLDGWTESWGAGSPWPQAGSNWIFGDLTSGDAYKGSDAGDQAEIVPIEKQGSLPTNAYFSAKWRVVYNGVSRTNSTLNLLETVPEISDANRKTITAEAKFLRAHFHFEAKKMWNKVPYIDEVINAAGGTNPDAFKVPNDKDIWPLIEADMKFAADNLPAGQPDVGRANKYAAAAYLAKIYMFQGKLAAAKPLLDDVIANGVTSDGKKYGLHDCFHDNFNATTKNGKESVFAMQASVNDGSNDGQNGNWGDILNFPYTGGPGTCCGFHQPSQNLVNSYKTDGIGLPLLDNFNIADVKNDQGVKSADAFAPHAGPVDPRLDWTVGRRGIPYLDWGPHPGADWIRDQAFAGPYSPKKRVFYKAQSKSLSTATGWTQSASANNYTLIRFADVLLWRAEIAADAGDLPTALSLVNQIRNRAKNGCKVQDGGANAANYQVEPYSSFPDKAFAIKAVRFERRLELALEGHRFFDLVRWNATSFLNDYYGVEGTKRGYLKGVTFTSGKNEYFPIPQDQIINSSIKDAPTLTQNPGY